MAIKPVSGERDLDANCGLDFPLLITVGSGWLIPPALLIRQLRWARVESHAI